MVAITINEYDDMVLVTKEEGVGRYVFKSGDTITMTASVIFAPYVGLGF